MSSQFQTKEERIEFKKYQDMLIILKKYWKNYLDKIR